MTSRTAAPVAPPLPTPRVLGRTDADLAEGVAVPGDDLATSPTLTERPSRTGHRPAPLSEQARALLSPFAGEALLTP
jgi:hypothetical protein